VYSVATCRAVVTVDWTTKKSAPAFLGDLGEALGALRMAETITGPPPFLISEMGRLGGLVVLNLEGNLLRYENPDDVSTASPPPARRSDQIIQGTTVSRSRKS